MTKVVIPYEPRPFQRDLHRVDKKRVCAILHRRAGKTVFAVNEMIRTVLTCERSNPQVWYIAPFFSQAKRIAWDELKRFSRPIPGIKINESELRISYPNGGKILLLGGDNPDAIRGVYSDLTVMDEYAQIAPNVLPEIVMPTLADRDGRIIALGTPKGRNHFWEMWERAQRDPEWHAVMHKASETGLLPDKILADQREWMSADQYAQEYECSFTASIQGAYYADQIKKLREENRITRLPIESNVAVNTAWDLGRNDTTAIVFFQSVGAEIRIIDCYECNGEGLDHYARVLKDKGYLYGDHYLPHDIEVTELTTNQSRRETLEALGVKPIAVVPRVRDINEGIEQTRQLFPRCWFDSDRCDPLLRALENYHKDYDEKRQVFRSRPLHDWSSNFSDAFRQIAQGFTPEREMWGEDINYSFAGIV